MQGEKLHSAGLKQQGKRAAGGADQALWGQRGKGLSADPIASCHPKSIAMGT